MTRNGYQQTKVTAKSHGYDGAKTQAQIHRDHADWLESQPMTAGCAWCPWTHTGTVGECRERSAAHRAVAHPLLRPRSIEKLRAAAKKRERDLRDLAFEQARALEGREPKEATNGRGMIPLTLSASSAPQAAVVPSRPSKARRRAA